MTNETKDEGRGRRILFASSFYAPEIGGGAELTMQRLVNGLTSRGYTAAVMTTGEVECTEVVEGVTVHRFPIDNSFRKLNRDLPGKLQRTLWQIRDRNSRLMEQRFDRLVRSFKPDVVQFHNLSGITRSVWAVPRRHGIPSVQVLHDLNLICPNSSMFKHGSSCVKRCGSCILFRQGYALASNDVSAAVGVSRYVLGEITGAGLFAQAKQRAIYNAQRLPGPSPLPASETMRFGYIGSLAPHKGVEWLIEQFESDMGELLIAGSGTSDYVERLKSLAEGKRITFLGHRPSLEFFPAVHVGVAPSIWNEALGGVAIEGSAHGRPVIASRRGGLPEVVDDGVTGILVDPDRPETLGDAMRTLSRDPAMVSRMARAGPKNVETFTNLDRFVGEYERLYDALGVRDQSLVNIG
ncbi:MULTISPECIES: glycosyltransferase family 4 protein [unclassified Novosphingobium]|uniref:glycosyltransferase family 4 protein n=1 Tax=unclassified Novosphingobium TaxID=2644732 RepID=UPI00135A7C6D|nr:MULTISPECIES: glycosyltransferase family 4 protein [unclassified Novosphingobium]